MSGMATSGPSPADFRQPEFPADRVLALETLIEVKGNKLPEPPRCHGRANCCHCPVCEPRRKSRPARKPLAA